ncbi:hypothetical protein [Pseudoalteromonas luteoviolacea]|uniref:hypothetical protein n=1 Tax=Pseudoalteromonas luteoviolacea TaxID=43657 RepID=UPI001B36ABB5|nr:hypothetical protein [Pseudoalteromonas luteoviolacea]MBQ4835744.1 hypothetical protein [Pseudoalteromonas luteoviolacea]
MKCFILVLLIVSACSFASKPSTPSKEYLNSLSPNERGIALEYEAKLKEEFFHHLGVLTVERLEILLKLREKILADSAESSQIFIDGIIFQEARVIYGSSKVRELTEYQKSILLRFKNSIEENELAFSGKNAERNKIRLKEILEGISY